MSFAAASSNRPRFGVGPIAETIRFGSQPGGQAGRAADSEVSSAEIDLRQLRHHTKNTLQRLIGLIGESRSLHATPEGEQLAHELEHRICLSATISNALFGLTEAPGPVGPRLRQLAGAVVDLLSCENQTIRVGVSVRGVCPPHLRESVIRCAHELIGNAVKHGMKDRPSGRIAVRLVTTDRATTLTVTDNGWGFQGVPRSTGEGLSLARSLAEMHGGTLSLESADGVIATLELPNWG